LGNGRKGGIEQCALHEHRSFYTLRINDQYFLYK
jgi:hypothetical protein